MELTSEDIEILVGTANALLRSPEVRRMNGFLQHGRTSCLQHSLAVAYVSLCLRRLLHMRADRYSLVRGALLHDFFLYDWHEKHAGHNLHGWTHPATALRNARQRFALNTVEQNIISSHMWPFTLRRLPRSREAMLVNLAVQGVGVQAFNAGTYEEKLLLLLTIAVVAACAAGGTLLALAIRRKQMK